MSMPETTPLKPADQTNYLLGQLSGQFTALQQSVESSHASQSTINASNESEHAEFRRAISELTTGQAVLLAQQQPAPARTPWWQIAGGSASVVTILTVAVAVVVYLTNK